ncbi:MAG: hypothetical protein ABI607_14685 [Betaproteobacteria bacterium]
MPFRPTGVEAAGTGQVTGAAWPSFMRTFIAIVFTVLCAPMDAFAQSDRNLSLLSANDLAEASAACDQLAGMPSAPMSVEACKAMINMGTRLDAAAADPSARRPGDEAMTCAAIFAELKGLAAVGISETSMARAEAVVRDGSAQITRQSGEVSAFIVESYALGAAVGALGAVTPNFVGAAIAAAWQAQFIALGAKLTAEQAPLRARTNEALMASADELNQSMQANPRFARLVALGASKRCEPPANAPR